jgi:hypothetical protein
LVSDLRSRLGLAENFDSIIANLEYGVEQELEEFAKMLLVLLTETVEEKTMSKTIDNGLSTSSQQAKRSS